MQERRTAMNSQMKHGVVWGGLLILFGIISLLETFVDLNAWVWVVVLTAAGLGIYGFYATDRTEKWMLYVSYGFLAIALMVALITLNVLRDEAVAVYVLLAIALPFALAFLRDNRLWGLLIPAYVLLAVSLMVGLIGLNVLDDLLIPAYVMFAIALPFFSVYLRNNQNWWALIPGGIMAFIGLSFLIADASVRFIVPVGLILVGGWLVLRQFIRRDGGED
jgi:hypothetical protein